MLVTGSIFAGLAALAHVYIFAIESLLMDRPSTHRTFGITAEQAEVLKPLFYNQGFYNLFLALGTGAGLALLGANRDAGVALILFGTGSMLAAALVLVTSDRRKARAALAQGLFPVLSLASLLVWGLG